MASRDSIVKILDAAAQAPSGSNSQPWSFEVRGDAVGVRMHPEKDHPILNVRSRGTLVAVGAAIENMLVAARHYNFSADVQYFPDKNDANLVARIALAEGGDRSAGRDLFDAIYKRSTNRKTYETRKMGDELKKSFASVPGEIGAQNIAVGMVDDKKEIEALATAASVNEIIMFENEALHKLFFEEIVWTEEEEKKKKSGLYLKTMELKPPQVLALRLFRKWSVLNFLNKFGAARSIAKSNAKGYAQCGAYGAILCDDNDRDFVAVGRVMEYLWLLATAEGLSFHIQTGTNFLYQSLSANEDVFSPEQAALIRDHYGAIANIFAAGGRLVPITFRLGYDGEPSARSSKKAPEMSFK